MPPVPIKEITREDLSLREQAVTSRGLPAAFNGDARAVPIKIAAMAKIFAVRISDLSDGNFAQISKYRVSARAPPAI